MPDETIEETRARITVQVNDLVASMADFIDLLGEADRVVTLPDGRRYRLTISPG